MSVLTLTTLRCPDIVPVDRRRVTGGEFVIGRGEDCDWRLPDPDKKLSKHHCVLEYGLGGWQVRDVSTNGTFLNDGPERIARDTSRPIVDGDRLRLGPYEIEARIAAERADPQPYRSDPFAPDLPLPAEGSPAVAQRVPADLLPPLAGVDPLFPRAPAGPLGPLIPDDFDPAEDFDATADRAPSSSLVFTPPPVVYPLEKNAFDDVELMPPQPDAPATPMAPDLPAARIPAEPASQPGAARPVAGTAASAPRPSTVGPAPPDRETPRDGAGVTALLDGAGIGDLASDKTKLEGQDTLRRAGSILRQMVAGLRSMLAARSDVKREFRIQPTVLQRGRNNPVKFAASDKHALAALLEPSQPAEQDVREIVNDLVLHEIATLAATQAAARSLLERLGPDQLDEEDSGMNILPGAREKRLWQAYCRLHKQMTEQFDDDFDSVFGKAFARAYEDEAARRRG